MVRPVNARVTGGTDCNSTSGDDRTAILWQVVAGTPTATDGLVGVLCRATRETVTRVLAEERWHVHFYFQLPNLNAINCRS